MDAREERGLQIAALSRITKGSTGWVVPSQSGNGKYLVKMDQETPKCNCPDFELRKSKCKHVYAVEFVIRRETKPDGSETVTATQTVTHTVEKRQTYRQNWPAYNMSQTNEKEKFQVLLRDLCRGLAGEPAKRKRGNQPTTLADVIFCVVFKIYSTVSGRRFMCDLKDAHVKGHVSRPLHYNTIFKNLESPELTPVLRGLIEQSSLPLKAVETDFAGDSTGFMTSRFHRWFDAKYAAIKAEHDWIKVSVMCGVKTNVITAVEVLTKKGNDSPSLPPMVKSTSKNFTIREVSADAGFLSNENFEVVSQHGGTAFIAFKANTTGSIGGMFEKAFHFYRFHTEEFLSHYHKRSNIESTFSMVKAKFGDSIRSKTDVAMVNEVLGKLLCHNICCLISSMYELGVNPVFWGESEETAPETAMVAVAAEEKREEVPLEAWAWV